MQLLLIRHAESSNNAAAADGSTARVPDPTLTERGFRQAAALPLILERAGYPRPDVLVSSLFRRTIETAAPLADALDLSIHAATDTFEIGGPYDGVWSEGVSHPGSARSVLAGLSRRVVLPDSATEQGWHTTGFETEEKWYARAASLWARLQADYADQTVALVSHGAISGVLLETILGSKARFLLANTATALVRQDERGTRLMWFNRLDHLAQEEISGL